MKILHILNGDSTYNLIKHSGIGGEFCIWREALVTGPVEKEVASPAFWQTRSSYIIKSYEGYNFDSNDIKPTEQDYYDKTIKEFDKVRAFANYTEAVLWFEHDLFCQINMIALLSWLYQNQHNATKISLVCINQYPGISNFRGLGQLKPADFATLLPDKIVLTREDLKFAHTCWTYYADSNPMGLYQLMNSAFPSAFPFLQKALLLHIKRFPTASNGLNSIEKNIIDMVQDGHTSTHKIVSALLQDDLAYGFGDLQYFEMIYQLKHLINFEEHNLSLNTNGQAVVANKLNNINLVAGPINIGGADGKKFIWDEKNEMLKQLNY